MAAPGHRATPHLLDGPLDVLDAVVLEGFSVAYQVDGLRTDQSRGHGPAVVLGVVPQAAGGWWARAASVAIVVVRALVVALVLAADAQAGGGLGLGTGVGGGGGGSGECGGGGRGHKKEEN